MKISVVTPSLNQACFLLANIDSVANQTFTNCEHIIIDGCSNDGTVDILKSHTDILWVSEPDSGQANAVNKGLLMATGDIIGWLNADDVYEPHCLERVVYAFSRDPSLGLLYGSYKLIDSAGQIIKTVSAEPWRYKKLTNRPYSFIANQTVFIRREVFRDVGLVDESLHFVMDHDYWIRVGARWKVACIPDVLAGYRHHGAAKTHSASPRMKEERRLLWERSYQGWRWSRNVAWLVWTIRGVLSLARLRRTLAHGDPRGTWSRQSSASRSSTRQTARPPKQP